ncbi:AAA family ATPase [Alicyclobacillaceae bacterium I2511]|nr:AAA family ATPase [Alicyclobacillaceae bacterium I2511]
MEQKGKLNRQQSYRVIEEYRDGRIPLTAALARLAGEDAQSHRPGSRDLITRERLQASLQEFDQLVGLQSVKTVVAEILSYLYMQERRQSLHLRNEPLVLHMVFMGNPGTGKTTVARLLARMFHDCGVLEKGHLVEVERADLVGEYIGHTAQKTRDVIKRALGGVMFIDEAYSLARGGSKDFGRESIDALVKGMEDYRNQFIAIIAGYQREMEWFLDTNPGLPSRFPIHLQFPDYDLVSLLEIARRTAAEREYRFNAGAEIQLRSQLQRAKMDQLGQPFGNARLIRNIVERAVRRHAVRLFEIPHLSREQAMTLLPEDFIGEDAQACVGVS